MSIQTPAIESLAEALLQAEAKGTPISPLTEAYPDLSSEDAYAVQQIIIQRRLAAGARIVGKKVGLTSLAMQRMLNVDQPDYGMILDNMLVEDGSALEVASLLQPKVEPEIAFRLKKDLSGPGVTVEQVLDATDYLFPALEIIDSRIRDWKIKLADTIADNASSARVVIGEHRVSPRDVDLEKELLVFEKNGEELGRATADAVLGNPAKAVAWCANKLSEYGTVLKAGEFVIPGALTGAAPVQAGDTVVARFGTVGAVTIRFV